MPLVRCSIHNIPYNSDNPRGCPACAREKEGANVTVMEELARASRATRGIPEPVLPPPTTPHPEPPVGTPPPPTPPPRRPSRRTQPQMVGGAVPPGVEEWQPVTRQPTPPTGELTPLRRIQLYFQTHPPVAIGAAATTLVALWLVWAFVPRFSEQPDPPPITGEARPLPLVANVPITTAFLLLGTNPPTVNAQDNRLSRYIYGPDLEVDELNGEVYAIVVPTSVYSWGGLRVGMDEQTATGMMALVGEVRQQLTKVANSEVVGGYTVYRSRTQRPERTLTADVRPPNGCFDVSVRLSPQILGHVTRGTESFVAVAKQGSPESWIVSSFRIVSRHLAAPGPQPAPTGDAPPPESC
jgi:hypothetical protein